MAAIEAPASRQPVNRECPPRNSVTRQRRGFAGPLADRPARLPQHPKTSFTSGWEFVDLLAADLLGEPTSNGVQESLQFSGVPLRNHLYRTIRQIANGSSHVE